MIRCHARRWIGALAAVTLMLCVVPGPPAGAGDAWSAVNELLDRRAEAVRNGDKRGFMATVGPRDSRFARSQARWFERITSLPLTGYSLEVDLGAYGDLARPSDAAKYAGAQRVLIPLTVESYKFAGYDEDPVVQDMYLTFVQRAGSWTIESDSDLDDLGFLTQRNLWDFSPVEVTESRHLVGISGACSGCPSAGAVLDVAEEALSVVDRYWDRPWNKRVPIYAPQGSEELAAIIQATYPVDNYVAFAFWTGDQDQNPGPRIIVNSGPIIAAGRSRTLSILTHELFHVAALSHSGPYIPRFIEEGLAQFVQYEGSAAVVGAADASSSTGLPADYMFFDPNPGRLLQTYRTSLSAVAFAIDRWGSDRFMRFYVRLGRRGIDPGIAAYHLDSAMRDVLGVGVKRFEDLWASSIGA